MTTSITLYGFQKPEVEASPSGYCQKIETFFRACKLPYTHAFTMPFQAPKGKLPYIALENEKVADSHFIVKHLVSHGIAQDLDVNLSPAQSADSKAWIAWVEERVYPIVVYTRWMLHHNRANVVAALPLPWGIRQLLGWYFYRNINKALYIHGCGRHTDEERESMLREYVDALDAKIREEGKELLFANEPTLADVVTYGFLANSWAGPGNKEYKEMLNEKEAIKDYARKLTELWFPEYESLLKELKVKDI